MEHFRHDSPSQTDHAEPSAASARGFLGLAISGMDMPLPVRLVALQRGAGNRAVAHLLRSLDEEASRQGAQNRPTGARSPALRALSRQEFTPTHFPKRKDVAKLSDADLGAEYQAKTKELAGMGIVDLRRPPLEEYVLAIEAQLQSRSSPHQATKVSQAIRASLQPVGLEEVTRQLLAMDDVWARIAGRAGRAESLPAERAPAIATGPQTFDKLVHGELAPKFYDPTAEIAPYALIALYFIPYVGAAVGVYEGVRGESIGGEPVTGGWRILALLPLLGGIKAATKAARAGARILSTSKLTRTSREALGAVSLGTREVVPVGRTAAVSVEVRAQLTVMQAPGREALATKELDLAIDEAMAALERGEIPQEGELVRVGRRGTAPEAVLDIAGGTAVGQRVPPELLKKTKGVLGKRIADLPEPVREAWRKAVKATGAQHGALTPENYAQQYKAAQARFWANVRREEPTADWFRANGFSFETTKSGAPAVAIEHAGSARKELAIELDHMRPKGSEGTENWRQALDENHIQLITGWDNWLINELGKAVPDLQRP